MTFGELVAAIGAAELLVLLLGLAAMLAGGGPPPRLVVEPRVEREEPRKVKAEAAV